MTTSSQPIFLRLFAPAPGSYGLPFLLLDVETNRLPRTMRVPGACRSNCLEASDACRKHGLVEALRPCVLPQPEWQPQLTNPWEPAMQSTAIVGTTLLTLLIAQLSLKVASLAMRQPLQNHPPKKNSATTRYNNQSTNAKIILATGV